MTTISASSTYDVRQRMRTKGIELYGIDTNARLIPPIVSASYPFTSAAYALECLRDWQTMMASALSKLIAGNPGGGNTSFDYPSWAPGGAAYQASGAGNSCLTSAKAATSQLGAGKLPDIDQFARDIAQCDLVAAKGVADLYDAYVAVKAGGFAKTVNAAGYRVMDPVDNRLFWDATLGVQQAVSAANQAVTYAEKWAAFKLGLKEGSAAVAEAAGTAAGAVLATAGGALGKGIGAFFTELGIVKTVVLAGGVFFVWRAL